jgi:SAM-dependent methyltransferase
MAEQMTLIPQSLSFRGRLCLALSRPHLRKPVPQQMAAMTDYQAYRDASLATSWARFSDTDVNGRDVLDFGCGNGPLSLFLATTRQPRSMTGVDLYPDAIARAAASLATIDPAPAMPVRFLVGGQEGMPVPDQSADTLLAFDCLEHVMDPAAILTEWHRVLRPGGKALIEWFPYAGPHGPHMDALIPIPWAHHLFGQRAMFETCEALYDDPAFQPRHWDRDEMGAKLPNKWRQWRSFAEQGYINELSTRDFRRMARQLGFSFARFERHGVMSNKAGIAPVTRALAHVPVLGELITSHVIVELRRD